MSDYAYTRKKIVWETTKYVLWMFYLNPLAVVVPLTIWMLTLSAIVWQGYWGLAAIVVHALIWYWSYRTVKSDLPQPVEELWSS